MRFGVAWLLGAWICVTAAPAHAQNLIVDGVTQTLSGEQRYDHICVINGGRIEVGRYTGGSKSALGNLELLAGSVYVDATSSISARGRGYQARQCSDGTGPDTAAGGRGGCSVFDSGGGGAHFGDGGRGTVDLRSDGMGGFEFYDPVSFEDDCNHDFTPAGANPTPSTGPGGTCPANGVACGTAVAPCSDSRGGRYCRLGSTVAGDNFWHSLYQPEFGAAGGDKGCLDGDGMSMGDPIVGGHGGGRVVIAGLTHLGDGTVNPCVAGLATGEVRFDGTLDAGGARGCGHGNDSGGGGAGGTVMVVGGHVEIGAAARLSAAGALGGDTNAKDNDPFGDCAANSQDPGGTCDDCGGGGGGGIISVLSVTSDIDPAADFDVSGATGGTCPVCQGEAGGGAGELQIDGAYVGEYCDGFDNDFDGMVDEGLGSVDCGYGACEEPIPTCSSGVPTACLPDTGPEPSCGSPVDGARARISIVLDTSASMLLDLSGNPTFGDGSVEQPGRSTDGDGQPNDSRLFLAREAVAQVVSAYPEIDFALARYYQDQALLRACQTATWFECQDLVASYDDPADNTGTIACTKNWGNSLGSVQIRVEPSPTGDEECINYAGSCGPPRRGANVLSGFGSKVTDLVRWLDGRETAFRAVSTEGNVCDHAGGGDCELRGSGPTPLAGSLLAMEDYIGPIRSTDPAVACRGYSVILVTDGAESCNGDPAASAARLHDQLGIEVYVIAVSVLPSEVASLDAIAAAGSGGTRTAIPVNSAQALVTSLTQIIAGSIKFETCNGLDDDCDGAVDEDFPGLGDPCDDGLLGACNGTGAYACNGAEDGIECVIDMPGVSPSTEICNDLDDNCNGAIDEGLTCNDPACVPNGDEVCNGADDDCDGNVDEDDPAVGNVCGDSAGECEPGRLRCVQATLQCVGGRPPMDEVCDGDDDDCNGAIDDDAPCPNDGLCYEGSCRRPCDPNEEFPCSVGFACEMVPEDDGYYCLPDACAACGADERCENDVCVDRCQGVSCGDGEACQQGECVDCHTLGCADGELCFAGQCQADACASADCAADEICRDGSCSAVCEDATCPDGERCAASGDRCEADPCSEVTCAASEYCDDGECRADPCVSVRCLKGDVCVPALGCVDDPCTLVVCPTGRGCAVSDRGSVECVVPGSGTGAGGQGGSGGSRDAESAKLSHVSGSGARLVDCSVAAGPRAGTRGGTGLVGLAWLLAGCALLRRRRT
jgi:hypothetical protein